jgi:hypothetical protein
MLRAGRLNLVPLVAPFSGGFAMAETRLHGVILVALVLAVALAVGGAAAGRASAEEFKAQAAALPFPPDARDLQFVAWTRSGWEHDEAAAKVEDNAITLTFQHDPAKVKVELRQRSKEVSVNLACDKLDFEGTDDPQKLAAAGIPVARAALLVQQEMPLPPGAVNVQYTGEGCTLKSPLALPEAFDYFTRLAAGKGFRESRRPIVTDTRRYTEFKRGLVQLNVNVFTDAVGSRIILTYKDPAAERPVPPLAAVASLPIGSGGKKNEAAGQTAAAIAGAAPVDVTQNKGSATVTYAGQRFTFPHVVAYRTKGRGSYATMLAFSAQPIPYQKLQSLLGTKNDPSFGDLFEFGVPNHLVVQLGDHLSFSFSGPGVGIGDSVQEPDNQIKLAADRVEGTLKMPAYEVFSGKSISFVATASAAILTPSTRITGPADPVVKSDSPILADAPLAFPEGVENLSSEGSKFRKKYVAEVKMPLSEVAAFYRQEFVAKGWTQPSAGSSDNLLSHQSESLELTVTLRPEGGKTAVEVVTRDVALAKREGIHPEAGKGRLILGNASGAAIVYSIGNQNYPLRPQQGAKEYRQALNYSLAPGTYAVVLRFPGKPPQTERIEVAEGSAWGVIALPTGECLPLRLY